MEEKKEEMLCIRITAEEKERLKRLAKEERKTLKGLLLSAIDKVFPGWNKEEKKGN